MASQLKSHDSNRLFNPNKRPSAPNPCPKFFTLKTPHSITSVKTSCESDYFSPNIMNSKLMSSQNPLKKLLGFLTQKTQAEYYSESSLERNLLNKFYKPLMKTRQHQILGTGISSRIVNHRYLISEKPVKSLRKRGNFNNLRGMESTAGSSNLTSSKEKKTICSSKDPKEEIYRILLKSNKNVRDNIKDKKEEVVERNDKEVRLNDILGRCRNAFFYFREKEELYRRRIKILEVRVRKLEGKKGG